MELLQHIRVKILMAQWKAVEAQSIELIKRRLRANTIGELPDSPEKSGLGKAKAPKSQLAGLKKGMAVARDAGGARRRAPLPCPPHPSHARLPLSPPSSLRPDLHRAPPPLLCRALGATDQAGGPQRAAELLPDRPRHLRGPQAGSGAGQAGGAAGLPQGPHEGLHPLHGTALEGAGGGERRGAERAACATACIFQSPTRVPSLSPCLATTPCYLPLATLPPSSPPWCVRSGPGEALCAGPQGPCGQHRPAADEERERRGGHERLPGGRGRGRGREGGGGAG